MTAILQLRLKKQITDTNTKIDNIKTERESKINESEKKVIGELNDLSSSIKAQLVIINTDIANLKLKDIEHEGKIADIKTYIDNEIKATKNWANATFATLEQYNSVQLTIAGINTDIKNINTRITDIETDIAAKMVDINASIIDLDKKLVEQVEKVTTGYANAVATAKTEIIEAYTKAISDAINASETSMKLWVTETLSNGYYGITVIDAKLAALETKITDSETILAKQINDQQVALEQAKSDLTVAYKKAIADAIETNNGVMNDTIKKAVHFHFAFIMLDCIDRHK